MSSEEEAQPYFVRYGLADLPRISDRDCALYRAFGLERLRWFDFIRPAFLWRGFQSSILKRHGLGSILGDEFQLPGAFLIHQGKMIHSHFYKQPWEHPDFVSLSDLSKNL